jgi:hypothetical protein
MVSYDDKRILCRDSYTVARLIEQTIFAKITPETTPEQFAAAQQALSQLCQRFEAKLDLFHYAAIRGSHQCIPDVYEDARARLELLAIMQPQAKAPGAPNQAPLTRDEVWGFFENTPPPDTDFGEDRTE